MTTEELARQMAVEIAELRAENEALKDRTPHALPIYGDPRPMSEAPRDRTEILAHCKDDGNEFVIVWWSLGYKKWLLSAANDYSSFEDDEFLGWWPLPKGTT